MAIHDFFPTIRRIPLLIIKDPAKSTPVVVKGLEICNRLLGRDTIRGSLYFRFALVHLIHFCTTDRAVISPSSGQYLRLTWANNPYGLQWSISWWTFLNIRRVNLWWAGSIIGCFWASYMFAFCKRPPTNSTPSWMKGFKLFNLLPRETSLPLSKVCIFFWKLSDCTLYNKIFSALFKWDTVR